MKYQELLQIATYLKEREKLHFIKRIDDNVFIVNFDKEELIFDMNRSQSAIYKANLTQKNYSAPFDIMLKKYFSNALIQRLCVLENNRILLIECKATKSYKELYTKIYFEFTGKNTNAIITDENDMIIEALRHIEKSVRPVKVGTKLEALPPFTMDNEFQKIKNFNEYFQDVFTKINTKKMTLLKANKKAMLAKKTNALHSALDQLENEQDLFKKADGLSQKAALITANLYKLKDYEREFSLMDYNAKEFKFKLDKAPKIWANEAFKNAKKLKQKANNLHLQRSNLLEKLHHYTTLLELVENANSSFELEILVPRKERKEKKEEQNLSVAKFYYNELIILIGKNEKANEYLLKNAKKDDMWFHIKDYPSAHAFIVSNKQKLSDDVIQFAAKLCVSFSNLNKGTYFVDYTTRKFVSIKQKAFVHYVNHKSIRITKE